MEAIIALIITFFVGLVLKVKGCSPNKALALASLIMPSFFFITGFILPSKDGSNSMWYIALMFGTIYGIIVGGLGVVAGAYFLKWQLRTPNKSE